ncbi:AfsR/SARP family transcriptional regulator [Streptomyces sp. HMX87]|uniref:AfsR/SARP family transcriptional regulator n=1 Tax=Streptomyces sp. HMX87 TaxID=3390849 RepID=UPI003A849D4D
MVQHGPRRALCKERRAAELDYTDLRLRLGEHTALLAMPAQHSATHPLDERLAAQYMLALYRSGRQADALAHYRHLRGLLADELGSDPGQELQRLHQAILNGSRDLSPPCAAPPVAATAIVAKLPGGRLPTERLRPAPRPRPAGATRPGAQHHGADPRISRRVRPGGEPHDGSDRDAPRERPAVRYHSPPLPYV